jgi:hypothetical protein
MVSRHIVRAETPTEDSMQIIFNPTITLSLLLAVASVPCAAQSASAGADSQTTSAHGKSKSGSQYGALQSKANRQYLDLNGMGGDILGAPRDYSDADTAYLGAPSIPFIPPEDRSADDTSLPTGQGLSLSSERSGGTSSSDTSSDTLGTDLSQAPKSKQTRIGHSGTTQATRKSPTGTLDAGGDVHPVYRNPW